MRETILLMETLANKVDDLVLAGRIVAETDSTVSISSLTASEVSEVIGIVDAIGWSYRIEDSSTADVDLEEVVDYLEPYRVEIEKELSDTTLRLLTKQGFYDYLRSSKLTGYVVEVASLTTSFKTLGFLAVPWGGSGNEFCAEIRKSPLAIVKSSGGVKDIPSNISPLILRDWSDNLATDEVFLTWARFATIGLITACASEVEPSGQLSFYGQPRSRLLAPAQASYDKLGSEGFINLCAAVSWVYENESEVETRHGLLACEISRSAHGDVDSTPVFAKCIAMAHEGARIAFQFGLGELSKDSLKALSELRKSLADEASKLSESTKQLAASATGTLFLGIGLIFAKIMDKASSGVALGLTAILALYIASIIVANIRYIDLQKQIRSEWRNRLYRFLTDDDYQRMVLDPARKAEESVYCAMWLVAAVMALLLLVIFCV